jgi:hypothetical protein
MMEDRAVSLRMSIGGLVMFPQMNQAIRFLDGHGVAHQRSLEQISQGNIPTNQLAPIQQQFANGMQRMGFEV